MEFIDTQQIVDKHIVEKHSMIQAEAKHYGSKVDEKPPRKRNAAHIRYDWCFNPIEAQVCIQAVTYCQNHRENLKELKECLVLVFANVSFRHNHTCCHHGNQLLELQVLLFLSSSWSLSS
jgi:hypothetical protein